MTDPRPAAPPSGTSRSDALPSDASPSGASLANASLADASLGDASPSSVSSPDALQSGASQPGASQSGVSPFDASSSGASSSDAQPGASWSADVFDRLYAERPDPWDLAGSPYERDKRAATLAALPRPRFEAALEVGCSLGVLTEALAARCDRLLALDFAEAALARARARCAALPQVAFRCAHLPGDWPEGRFDLVVFSEVLYFLDAGDIARAAAACAASLLPGGTCVLVNWTGETDTPCTGEEAADRFIAAAGLVAAPPCRAPGYRLDVLRAGEAAL